MQMLWSMNNKGHLFKLGSPEKKITAKYIDSNTNVLKMLKIAPLYTRKGGWKGVIACISLCCSNATITSCCHSRWRSFKLRLIWRKSDPPKECLNPYFTDKCRCLSSVSLFFCRKALGLLTSSPLPSFLLSEGTHLKNENKVIVPVLFLK